MPVLSLQLKGGGCRDWVRGFALTSSETIYSHSKSTSIRICMYHLFIEYWRIWSAITRHKLVYLIPGELHCSLYYLSSPQNRNLFSLIRLYLCTCTTILRGALSPQSLGSTESKSSHERFGGSTAISPISWRVPSGTRTLSVQMEPWCLWLAPNGGLEPNSLNMIST